MTRVRYLSLLDFDDRWLAELQARVPGVEVEQRRAVEPADVPPQVWAGVDVLHTSAVLPDPDAVPRLRWVQLDTSGIDHVRGHRLWHRPVDVTTIGGISPVPLAEYVLFAVLGMAHRLPAVLALRESRAWPTPQQRWARFLPAPVAGANLTVVGYGRIGRQIARVARAHGMHVTGVNRSGAATPAELHAGRMQFAPDADVADVRIVGPDLLAQVAAETDYLVVVCPLTDDTRGLVGADVLSQLRPGAVVINVARGGVVDEDALRTALRSGRLGGAVLDVFAHEPLPPEDDWWDEPDVLITPHAAGLAPRYAEQVLDLVAENLIRFTSGLPLLNRVEPGQAY